MTLLISVFPLKQINDKFVLGFKKACSKFQIEIHHTNKRPFLLRIVG